LETSLSRHSLALVVLTTQNKQAKIHQNTEGQIQHLDLGEGCRLSTEGAIDSRGAVGVDTIVGGYEAGVSVSPLREGSREGTVPPSRILFLIFGSLIAYIDTFWGPF